VLDHPSSCDCGVVTTACAAFTCAYLMDDLGATYDEAFAFTYLMDDLDIAIYHAFACDLRLVALYNW